MSETVELTPREHLHAQSRPGARAYTVTLDGGEIGHIEQTWPSFERGPPGRRYVTKRWTAKRARWAWEPVGGGYYHWCETRKAAVEALVAHAKDAGHE